MIQAGRSRPSSSRPGRVRGSGRRSSWRRSTAARSSSTSSTRSARPGSTDIVVVLGTRPTTIDDVDRWSGERRVVNPEPDRGLSSSLQVGFAALGTATRR